MCALHRLARACAALVVFAAPYSATAEGKFTWDNLPDLPPPSKGADQKGLAGLFGGTHGGVLILAGGANFPDEVPWKKGVKTYWNDIYVLEQPKSGKPVWVDIKTKLPKPIAYGASVSTERGVVCIGGADTSQCYPDVVLLKWNPETRDVDIEKLPPLPIPLAHSTAAQAGDVIYVAGGIKAPFTEGTKAFFALDLNPTPPAPAGPDTDPETSEPGGIPENGDPPHNKHGSGSDETPSKPAGKEPGKAVGENADSDAAGTASKDGPGDSETHPPDSDGSEGQPIPDSGGVPPDEPKPIKPEVIEEPDSPDPKEPETPPVPLMWKELPTWDGHPRAFSVSAAQSDGERTCFFLFSGRNPKADGTSQQLVDAHKFDPTTDQWIRFPDIAPQDAPPRSVVAASAAANGDRSILIFGGDDGTMAKVSALVVAAANSTSRDAYLKLNETILENHPGYSRDILSLDTIDGIWKNVATFPGACPVTTPVIRWNSSIVIPSGETRPGVRSVKLWKGTWKPR